MIFIVRNQAAFQYSPQQSVQTAHPVKVDSFDDEDIVGDTLPESPQVDVRMFSAN